MTSSENEVHGPDSFQLSTVRTHARVFRCDFSSEMERREHTAR